MALISQIMNWISTFLTRWRWIMMKYFIEWRTSMKNKMESAGLEPYTIDAECQAATHWAIWDILISLFIKDESLFPRKNTIVIKFSKCCVGAKMKWMVRIRYVHMGLWKLPRFGAFFVLKGTAFRCFILEPLPDVPLVRLWGSIGTRIPIWEFMSLTFSSKSFSVASSVFLLNPYSLDLSSRKLRRVFEWVRYRIPLLKRWS